MLKIATSSFLTVVLAFLGLTGDRNLVGRINWDHPQSVHPYYLEVIYSLGSMEGWNEILKTGGHE